MSIKENQTTYTLDEVRTIARNALQTGREHALVEIADFFDGVGDQTRKGFINHPGTKDQVRDAMSTDLAYTRLRITAEMNQERETEKAEALVEAIIADLGATDDNKRLKGAA